VQLIDAETGTHLWAERFDKPLTDLFDMQDEIVARLASALNARRLPLRPACAGFVCAWVSRPRKARRRRPAYSRIRSALVGCSAIMRRTRSSSSPKSPDFGIGAFRSGWFFGTLPLDGRTGRAPCLIFDEGDFCGKSVAGQRSRVPSSQWGWASRDFDFRVSADAIVGRSGVRYSPGIPCSGRQATSIAPALADCLQTCFIPPAAPPCGRLRV
jgi:hypothetical protein